MSTEPLDRWGFPIRGVQTITLVPEPVATPRPVRGPGSPDAEKVLEGLRRLHARAVPGHEHTWAEMAAECECSKDHIRLVARSGLRKLRAKLEPLLGQRVLEDLLRATS